ncbi:peptidoglycan-recognition protein SB2-like [Neocloeon triangulifer]|uniref:peptidoglycan-recognition protein SB2-like n=1 Tax=Neocloeon triangulifer TaxID=2078957 RepID=UPI00286ED115|nr:peptidoglycan-recognition protein SB2-like [Neocloeon triangulifer]
MNLQIALGLLLLISGPTHVLCIFNRRTWGARTASTRLPRFDGPAALVVIHTTNTDPCAIPSQCKSIVRDLQIKSMALGSNFTDIPYNFLIGCCGGVYEGTGWDFKAPISWNYKGSPIHVALVGYYDDTAVPVEMSQTLRSLISEALLRNKLKKPYTITEHKSSAARKLMVKSFLQGFKEYEEHVNDLLLPEQPVIGTAAGSTTPRPTVSARTSTIAGIIRNSAATTSKPAVTPLIIYDNFRTTTKNPKN